MNAGDPAGREGRSADPPWVGTAPARPDPLDERTVDPGPLSQFDRWYRQAAAAVAAPEAMALATATSRGRPSMRMVLLKSFGDDGFVFYTNYDSRKSHELDSNPEAALLFHWEVLGRQVRIEGGAARTSPAESDAYFATRGTGSRISAYASHQSAPIADRLALDAAVSARRAEFAGRQVPRPAWWGGWRVSPRTYEFWQQGEDRLHDRVHYERAGDGWTVRRLQP
jgi:pyridoxamine 5'-phosphate oxidase